MCVCLVRETTILVKSIRLGLGFLNLVISFLTKMLGAVSIVNLQPSLNFCLTGITLYQQDKKQASVWKLYIFGVFSNLINLLGLNNDFKK